MDRFVTLDRAPEGYRIPPEYADRLTYDAETRRLSFRGFMSKSDFDRLCARTSDWGLRRKLEELFLLCDYNDGPNMSRRGGLLAALKRRFAPG